MRRNTCFLIVAMFLLSSCSSRESTSQDQAGKADSQTITTKSGLQIDIVSEGSGSAIQNGQQASVHYTGWIYDENAADHKGDQFDSSRDRGEPIAFPLGAGRVIQGWDEGVLGMKVGDRRMLTIPPDLGYGARGYPPVIPANATLLFDVELVQIGQ